MIAKIIGDTWKKLTRKDQEEIVNIFQEYIAKNYIKRFKKKLKTQPSIIKNQKKLEKLMLVKTDLVFDKNDVIQLIIYCYLIIINGEFLMFYLLVQ